MNLVLSELGLIEKDIAGWKATKLGKSLGGTEHVHDISGAHYMLWTESILTYSRILEVFKHELDSTNELVQENEITQEKNL